MDLSTLALAFLGPILAHPAPLLSPEPQDRPAKASQADQPGASGTKANPAAVSKLKRLARTIQKQVEHMRDLEMGKPMTMGVKSKADITRFILERLTEAYGLDKVAAEGHMLEMFGLLPRGTDYADLMTRLLTEQVAGFYDHTRKTLHIADWLPEAMQTPVMAHEIFHALQDARWGVGDLIDPEKQNHDAIMAHAALLEGDATVVMFTYLHDASGRLDPTANKGWAASVANMMPTQMAMAGPEIAKAPDYLKSNLIFPYQEGLKFVGALREAGLPFSRFGEVYASPPASTEQILHPERYHPKPDVPSTVKIDAEVLKGWTRGWDSVGGEFHWRTWLNTGVEAAQAIEAAAGWDGDHLILASKGEQRAVLAAITWDSAEDAKAFHTAITGAFGQPRTGQPRLHARLAGTEVYLALSHDAQVGASALDALTRHTVITRR